MEKSDEKRVKENEMKIDSGKENVPAGLGCQPCMSSWELCVRIAEGLRALGKFEKWPSGQPVTLRRKKIWELLKSLNDQMDFPWMCVGDFNEIIFDYEKWLGIKRPIQHMEKFRETVQACNFNKIL